MDILAETTGFSSYIGKIARHAYLHHGEATKYLQTYVRRVIASSFDRLVDDQDIETFMQLVVDVPELSWGLLLKAQRDNKEWRLVASQHS